MEKEIRAICERYRKGEELIFESKVDSHLLKIGEEFLIYKIEVDDYNIIKNKFYLKSKCDKKSFSVESQELIDLFKLKHPKDPNELIGRKVKGFRFDGVDLSCCHESEKYKYLNRIGVIENYKYKLEDNSVKIKFDNDVLWYSADQIEAHLLPEKKTKKERIEELEKRVEELEKAVKIGMDELTKITTLRINGKIKEPEKQSPQFWYVDIVEEKDSELLPRFKEWFLKKINTRIEFIHSKYGFSGWRNFNGYDWVTYTRDWEGNSDKMQKITLNEWSTWFNK
jgi:hypothetical protein